MAKIKTVHEAPKRATTSIRFSKNILEWKKYWKDLKKTIESARKSNKKFSDHLCGRIYLIHMISHLSWDEMGLTLEEIEYVYVRAYLSKATLNKVLFGE